MMAGSIQKTLEGECVCESKVVLHGVEIYPWKAKRWERVVGGGSPKDTTIS